MPDLNEVHDSSDDWWRSCAELALTWWAQSGKPFDAFDITQLGVPDPDHPARWGALFRHAHTAGLIVPVGYHQSQRPSRSGGVCSLWQGVPDAEAPGKDIAA